MIENTHPLSVMPLRRSLGGGRVMGVMESSSSSSLRSSSSSLSLSSSQSQLYGSNNSTNRHSTEEGRRLSNVVVEDIVDANSTTTGTGTAEEEGTTYQAWARDQNGNILWWIWLIIGLCIVGCCCVSCCSF